MQYNISYNQLNSAVYENGQKTTKKISFKDKAEKGIKTQGLSVNDDETECLPVFPQYIGYPPFTGSGCTFHGTEEITYDPSPPHCATSIVDTYTYSTCPGGGSGSGSGGSGSGSSGSGSEPPYGGGGGSQQPSIYDIMNATNLSIADLAKLKAVFQEIINNCIGKAMYTYFKANNKKFDFRMNPNQSTTGATYNATNNNITFKTSNDIDAFHLTEEFFHGYQNYNYPGGIGQYSGTSPGGANIEFEAKFLQSMTSYIEAISTDSFKPFSYPVTGSQYPNYIKSLTSDGTKYPTSIPDFNVYKSYIQQFTVDNSGYHNTIVTDLHPTAIFNLINSSNCAH